MRPLLIVLVFGATLSSFLSAASPQICKEALENILKNSSQLDIRDSESQSLNQLESEYKKTLEGRNPRLIAEVASLLVATYQKENRPVEAAWTLMRLGPSKFSDKTLRDVETMLKSENVTSRKKIGRGVSDPELITLKKGIKGVFKSDNPDGAWATHSYNEIAAYTLDRLLGLNIVPPTVVRTINGKEGSLQYFINQSSLGDAGSIEMQVLDYLIAYEDQRGSNNRLVRPGNLGVAIDHGLSFGVKGSYVGIRVFPRSLKDLPDRVKKNILAVDLQTLKKDILPLIKKNHAAARKKRFGKEELSDYLELSPEEHYKAFEKRFKEIVRALKNG